jgi:hypothetical protein
MGLTKENTKSRYSRHHMSKTVISEPRHNNKDIMISASLMSNQPQNRV